jgi:hypothetical protein
VFEPEQERHADEQSLEGGLHAGFESAAGGPLFIEGQQGRQIGGGDRPAIGPPGHAADDALGTRPLRQGG